MIGRVIITVLILAVWGWVGGFFETITPLVAGPAATWQFDNSNTSYVMSQYGMRFGQATHWMIDVIAILVLLGLWLGPIRRALSVIILVVTASALLLSPAHAYYASQDYAEVYTVLPNESAFLIPDVGANKDTQAQFGSVDYLKANKVPLKRVSIPHVRLENSGWFANQVVPAARLVIVDRTPFMREWNADPSKGTSHKNEGFRCESKDSIAVTTAIAIAAYVTEEDAPQFLYHFGVNPPWSASKNPDADRHNPEVIFSSVLYGRSLEQVMDSNVHGKVHAALCAETAKLDLDELFSHKSDIMAAVEKSVRDTYTPMGITLEYIGFSDELSYEPDIQKAINRVYVSRKEALAAIALQPAMPVLQQEADMEIKRGLAAGLSSKGLPNMPSFMLLNKDIFDIFGGWLKSDYTPAKVGSSK